MIKNVNIVINNKIWKAYCLQTSYTLKNAILITPE